MQITILVKFTPLPHCLTGTRHEGVWDCGFLQTAAILQKAWPWSQRMIDIRIWQEIFHKQEHFSSTPRVASRIHSQWRCALALCGLQPVSFPEGSLVQVLHMAEWTPLEGSTHRSGTRKTKDSFEPRILKSQRSDSIATLLPPRGGSLLAALQVTKSARDKSMGR